MRRTGLSASAQLLVLIYQPESHDAVPPHLRGHNTKLRGTLQGRSQTNLRGGNLPALPFPSFLFPSLPFPFLPLPLISSPLYEIVWGSAVSSPSGIWGESFAAKPQPLNDLVHIWAKRNGSGGIATLLWILNQNIFNFLEWVSNLTWKSSESQW